MRTRTAAGMAAVAALAFLAGCSTDAAEPSTNAGAPTTAMAPTTGPAMAAPFGPGCAAVPTDSTNPGSFPAMAKVPVATAASGNPLLSTLVTAVTKANLGDSLNGAPALTVFAPTNDAFAKIPAADLTAVLNDDAKLKSVLTYHVVSGRLAPDKLAGTHKTLQGGEVTVGGSGTSFTVNGSAAVICGNVQTGNATVYIIDGVLMPKS